MAVVLNGLRHLDTELLSPPRNLLLSRDGLSLKLGSDPSGDPAGCVRDNIYRGGRLRVVGGLACGRSRILDFSVRGRCSLRLRPGALGDRSVLTFRRCRSHLSDSEDSLPVDGGLRTFCGRGTRTQCADMGCYGVPESVTPCRDAGSLLFLDS